MSLLDYITGASENNINPVRGVGKEAFENPKAKKILARQAEEKRKAQEAELKKQQERDNKKILAYANEVNSSHQRIIAKEISKYIKFYETHTQENKILNYTNIGNGSGTSASKARSTLLSVNGMEDFVNLDNAKLSSLVPRVRLFKVSSAGEVEFTFEEHQTPTSITSNRSMRGTGVGIKSVSIDMTGDSPATAERQFKVNLKLYFSNLDEIFRQREGYRYEELFLLPDSKRDSQQAKEGSTKEEHSRRIKMEYGYAEPDYSSINWTEKELKLIRQARRIITLGLIGHSIEYNENGSITVDLEYIGYIEKESLKIDVLRLSLTPEQRQRLDDLERNIKENAPKAGSQAPGQNTSEQGDIGEVKKAAAEIRTEGYQAFLKKVSRNRKIYRIKTAKFSKFGTTEEEEKYGIFGTGKLGRKNYPFTPMSGTENEDKAKSNEKIISFFFLGDLLDEVVGLANEHIVLKGNYEFAFGSFMFKGLGAERAREVSISSVPVSTEAFGKWFKEYVIKKGERTTYDLFSFINDVLNTFVAETFSPKFQSTSYGLRVESAPVMRSQTFNTTKFLPRGDYIASSFKDILNVGGDKKNSINYIYYYGENLQVEQDGFGGDPTLDAANGIYWLIAGAENGITKRIKYSKQEQKYLREARMTQQGINDNKSILFNLYKANVDLVGNPIFKPGMVVYLLPPSLSPSSAEQLGLAGYFQILKVGNSIEDGRYQTDLEAQWIRPRKARQ